MNRPDLYMKALEIYSEQLNYKEVRVELSAEEGEELDEYLDQIIKQNIEDDYDTE